MNAPVPKVTAPKLTPDEVRGLQNYWRIYETHREAINAKLMEMASQHHEIKFIMQNRPSASAEQEGTGLEMQRRAIFDNDWGPYLESLQQQGVKYAETGLSFQSWFDIIGAFRTHMIPYLLDAYGESPADLLSAINGMDCLVDIAMSTIGESYLETKQQLIEWQGVVLQENEDRYQDMFESAAISILVEDFSPVREGLAELQRQGVTDFSAYLSSHPAFLDRAIRDVRIVNVNQRSLKLFGAKSKEELLAGFDRIYLPETLEVFIQQLAALAEGRQYFEGEAAIQTLQGERRDVLVTVRFPDTDRQVGYTLVSMMDITERKQIERQLQENEQKYSIMFDKAPFGAALSKLPEGVIINVNKEFERAFGYTRQEAIGKTSLELGINPDAEGRARILAEIQERGAARNVEAVLRTKSGEARVFSLNIDMVSMGGEKYAIQTAQDVTERKRAEGELRRLNEELEQRVAERTERLEEVNRELEGEIIEGQRAEKRFRDLLEAAPDAIVIVNEGGEIVMVNAQTEKLFDYGRDGLVGKPVEVLIPGRFGDVHPRHRQKFGENPYPRPMGIGLQLHGLRRDGSEFPVEISLSPLQTEEGTLTSAAIRDITERQRAERKFRGLLESAPDAIVVVDEKGIIQLSNTQTEKMFGYKRDELLGQSVEALVPKRFGRKHVKHREGYYEEHPARPMGIGLELFGLRKNGTEFPVEISLAPLESQDGLLVSAAIRDVTQRKENEEEIQRLNEDLRQRAAQLEASNKELESFSYSVSHDLRAPLRSIDGFSQAVLEDYSEHLPPEGRDYLERVRNAAQRMGVLIDDLLNLSRITRATLQPKFVNLSAIAKEVAETLQEAHPGRKVEISIMPDLMVDGDPHLLHIALENLLSNAWKFTSKQEHAKIEFGQQSRHNNNPRTFYVRDNGVGFDMAYVDKLFGVFQRLHSISQFPGTGVGLATVRRIITIHGGRIWAESAEGNGAAFYFTL